MDHLDLNGLRVFAHVADKRSFTAAGDALGLTASAVSKAMNRLEAALGSRLLHRTTRSVNLTAEGAAFLSRCQAVLQEIEDATVSLRHERTVPQGRLRVLVPVGFGRRLIAPVLARFAEDYPGIVLDLELSDRSADILHEGLDLAVCNGMPADAGLVARHLCRARQVVCAAPAYVAAHGAPQSPDDLDQHRCLGYAVPHTQEYREWVFERDGKRTVKRPQGLLNINHAESVMVCAMAGAGIAMLSTFTTAEAVGAGKLQVLMPGYEGVGPDFYLVYPPNRQMSARVRAFADFVVRTVAEYPHL